MSADMVGAVGGVLAALAAGAGVAVAWYQLNNLNKALRMSGLMAVLQLESELNARKEKVDELSAKIRELGLAGEKKHELLVIVTDQYKGILENYFNAADRLAFCILKEYVPQKDWKAEYREYFNNIIKGHEGRFGPASPYKNVIDLNNRWQRE